MGEKQVVIVGGGYAGVAFLRHFSRKMKKFPVGLRLIDSSNHHAIKSRFHERAVSLNREPGISIPLRLLTHTANAEFTNDEILGIDFDSKMLSGRLGEYRYDLLVLALGGHADFHGITGAEDHTIPIDSLAAVRECANSLRILKSRKTDSEVNVLVCGAGIEGIEVATQISQVHGKRTNVTLIEGGNHVLPRAAYPSVRDHVLTHLEKHGIKLVTGELIEKFSEKGAHLSSGDFLPSDLSVWCGGVSRPRLAGLEGRKPLEVDVFFRSLHHPDVFAIGDCAFLAEGDSFANLFSAQRAVYQGELCANNAAKKLQGKLMKPASYRPIGELVALGDFDGVGDVKGSSIKGKAAATLKKLNEVKYLVEVTSQIPFYTFSKPLKTISQLIRSAGPAP